jgi:hypothetical protein
MRIYNFYICNVRRELRLHRLSDIRSASPPGVQERIDAPWHVLHSVLPPNRFELNR